MNKVLGVANFDKLAEILEPEILILLVFDGIFCRIVSEKYSNKKKLVNF